MALFRIFRCEEEQLNSIPNKEGQVYFTTDEHNLYLDFLNGSSLQRVKLNAHYADALRRIAEDGTIEEITLDNLDSKYIINDGTVDDPKVNNSLSVSYGIKSDKFVPLSYGTNDEADAYTAGIYFKTQPGKGGTPGLDVESSLLTLDTALDPNGLNSGNTVAIATASQSNASTSLKNLDITSGIINFNIPGTNSSAIDNFKINNHSIKSYLGGSGSGSIDGSKYVPVERQINGKTLEQDITLTASNIGAVALTNAPYDSCGYSGAINFNLTPTNTSNADESINGISFAPNGQVQSSACVPYIRGIVNTSLGSGRVGETIEISAPNVEFLTGSFKINGQEISTNSGGSSSGGSYVPTTRTINGHPLSANVTLTASDVGALSYRNGGYVGNSVTFGTFEADGENEAFREQGTIAPYAVSSELGLQFTGKRFDFKTSDNSVPVLTINSLPFMQVIGTNSTLITPTVQSSLMFKASDSIVGQIIPHYNTTANSKYLEVQADKVNFIKFSGSGSPEITINGESISNSGGVGYLTSGKTMYPEFGTSSGIIAGEGAEIFNDYREREYDNSSGSGTATIKWGNVATGKYSHAEGSATTASGLNSHTEGCLTKANGNYAHAEGYNNTASGQEAHAEGYNSIASGECSHVEGFANEASGKFSHAGGLHTKAAGSCEMVIGCYNKVPDNANQNIVNNYFVIGDGTTTARANCFRINAEEGVFTSKKYNSSGADYAELFEWEDGNPNNEDRVGRFVTLDGEKIRMATPDDDFILGVISSNPTIVGNVYDDQWQGMYLYDIYGRPIWEDTEEGRHQKLNPEYDSSIPYIPRSQRPEWDCVGMLGKLVVKDDGSCYTNGYCTVGENGIATYSGQKTKYRVLSRLNENCIKILIM